MDTKFGDFKEHWSIAALNFLKENLSTNFGLLAVFVKVALEITSQQNALGPCKCARF